MYTTLLLQIVPNARKSEILGMVDHRLKIKISAPAIEGKANQELIRFLAKEFSIPKRDIEIVSGESSKFKKVRVLTNQALTQRLAELVNPEMPGQGG